MIFAPPELPPDDPPGVVDVQRPVEILAGEGETVVEGELTIQWDAPEKCPDAEKMLASVQRYLAKDSKPAAAVIVRGRVQPRGSVWRLDMVLERGGSRSRRSLEARSCDLLTKGAALLVAVHVDAVGTSSRVRELESPVAPDVVEVPPSNVVIRDAAPPESSVTVREQPVPPPPPPIETGGVLRLVLTGGVGHVPRFPHGFALAGGVVLSSFRVEAQLDYAPPRQAVHPDDDNVRGRFQAIAGTVRGCWAPTQRRWTFPLCAGVRAGGLRGIGTRGVRVPVPKWAPWGALALEPAVVFSPIPRVGIFGSVGALVSFNRPGFAVGGADGAIFRVSAIAAVVSLGVEVNFSARNRGTR
jgi:hypothetical protein